jgi:transcriptional regulator with XRE-family HTH domain
MAKFCASPRFRYLRQDTLPPFPQNAKMAKDKQRWFLKQWRKHRGYTQERLAEMVGMSPGYFSDLEKGNRRYNQDHLEALAEALRCTPADLIIRDPSDPDGIWSVWDDLSAPQRTQVVEIAKTLKRTGTDG